MYTKEELAKMILELQKFENNECTTSDFSTELQIEISEFRNLYVKFRTRPSLILLHTSVLAKLSFELAHLILEGK